MIQMYKLKKYIKGYHFSKLIGTLYNRGITLNCDNYLISFTTNKGACDYEK